MSQKKDKNEEDLPLDKNFKILYPSNVFLDLTEDEVDENDS